MYNRLEHDFWTMLAKPFHLASKFKIASSTDISLSWHYICHVVQYDWEGRKGQDREKPSILYLLVILRNSLFCVSCNKAMYNLLALLILKPINGINYNQWTSERYCRNLLVIGIFIFLTFHKNWEKLYSLPLLQCQIIFSDVWKVRPPSQPNHEAVSTVGHHPCQER